MEYVTAETLAGTRVRYQGVEGTYTGEHRVMAERHGGRAPRYRVELDNGLVRWVKRLPLAPAREFPDMVELRRRGLVFRPGTFRDPEPDRSYVFTTPKHLGASADPWVFRWVDDDTKGAGWAGGPQDAEVYPHPWVDLRLNGLELVRVVRTGMPDGSTLLEPWDPGLEDDRPQREDGLEVEDLVHGMDPDQDELDREALANTMDAIADAMLAQGAYPVVASFGPEHELDVHGLKRAAELLRGAPNTADRRGG